MTSEDLPEVPAVPPQNDTPKAYNRDWRFWAIIATLCVISILASLENTVVTTSLPYIVTQLDLGENYVWVTNVFFLTSAAVQPLFGQLANIFGRRWVTMTIVALFTLGSGICGGATNGAMLIAGRAIQGMGSGGINMIVDVIISDLVPLRDRGNYMACVLTVYFVGTALGPWVGGIIVDSISWRWVFYINLPVGGMSMVMIFLFLQVRYNKEMSLSKKLQRIDYIGNFLIVASTVAILYALTYGGALTPWSSWRIILPLVLGLFGLILFMVFETANFVKEPVVPPRLFGNRTSATVFFITLLNAILLYWVLFFLPVYFQAVLGSSPARAGVQLLPIIVIAVPAAIMAVLLLAKFGKYKPLHLFGFAVSTLGMGLFTLLDEHSSAAEWIIFQIIAGGGGGFVLNTLLPACQAPLPESDQAAITAAWSFIRSFGSIWGVAIPAAVFNNRFSQLVVNISDPQARSIFGAGDAYQFASSSFLQSFAPDVREQVVRVYSESLKRVWQISIVFAGVAFLLVFLEKQIKLRTELETEFGLEEKKAEQMEDAEGSVGKDHQSCKTVIESDVQNSA
ncbi:putative multidrug resistance protein fnx1 protein [Phaeoacremonium minimum UCRPA7]|uniref:Putative multidrug resistance protein fnx1 protein n=1 Tax=Phaeoacremonium minimum (strain UCR-PA7) TaxID=1286976 RepID=R8BEU1_PHAM7|nr:putative multidrug resistance protein fnx1 protein [Phaeoacremonium minimum UCRPA7]EON97815.1 putative multidrug resistance protein fnx1 protein [Phaeoacremonium minimum UCRPA7]